MMTEADILDIKLQMEALISKRSKMGIENLAKREDSEPLAYFAEDYGELEAQFNNLREALIKLMEQ